MSEVLVAIKYWMWSQTTMLPDSRSGQLPARLSVCQLQGLCRFWCRCSRRLRSEGLGAPELDFEGVEVDGC